MIKTPLSTMIGGAFWTPGATIIGSSSKNLTQLIKSLFSLGERGFAYDPNDLTTLYQDAAGTIPVTTAGQPVGLMLDKSKGLVLGVEKSSYASGFSSLTGIIPVGVSNSLIDGALVATSISTDGNDRTEIPIANLVVGRLYTVEVVVKGNQVNNQVIYNWTVGSVPVIDIKSTDYTKYKFSFIATAASGVARVYAGASVGDAGGVIQVKSLSIKELEGNHAFQSTSASRPILQDSPRRIDFDAVDDKLITNLPAQLSGCTVVRSVPNIGTQILTNQTIPTPYNDNIDNCGLIVINRALTASETSQITKLFNKAAGV